MRAADKARSTREANMSYVIEMPILSVSKYNFIIKDDKIGQTTRYCPVRENQSSMEGWEDVIRMKNNVKEPYLDNTISP